MDEPFVIEPTPNLKSFRCKMAVWLLALALYALPFAFALFGWLRYDFFIAFCLLCFGYLLNGFIHSKIRAYAVPTDQRERSFSSHEMARWFVWASRCE